MDILVLFVSIIFIINSFVFLNVRIQIKDIVLYFMLIFFQLKIFGCEIYIKDNFVFVIKDSFVFINKDSYVFFIMDNFVFFNKDSYVFFI